MNQQSEEGTTKEQSIYTNSLIRLALPEQHFSCQYLFQWISEGHANNCILTRYDITKIAKVNQFQCTPLDCGAVITGRVISTRDGLKEIVKQEKFGPVQPETEILRLVKQGINHNVKIVFSKNHAADGIVKIMLAEKQTKDHKISIAVENKQFKFDIKLQQNIRLPSNNSFFKFYDRQQESLGISIYHQHSQFVERMKQVKNPHHFGFYLKIYFYSREQRDAFLFAVREALGIKVHQQQQQQKEQSDFKIVLKPSIIVNDEESDNEEKQIDRLIRNKTQHRIKELDDEIFKLLYQASEAGGNQLSIDMTDAEMLLSSTKKLDLAGRNLMKQSDLQNIDKKQSLLMQKNQNRPSSLNKDKKNQTLNKTIHMDALAQSHERNWNTNSKSYCFNNFNNSDENQLRSTITKLTNQVKNLLKQNKQLSQENKKLKDENMRLRFKEIKNASINRANESRLQNESQRIIKCRSGSISPINHNKRQSIYPSNVQCSTTNIEKPALSQWIKSNSQHTPDDKNTLSTNNAKLTESTGSMLINKITSSKTPQRNLTGNITYYNHSSNRHLGLGSEEPRQSYIYQTISNQQHMPIRVQHFGVQSTYPVYNQSRMLSHQQPMKFSQGPFNYVHQVNHRL